MASNLQLREQLPESGDGRISFRPPTQAEEELTRERKRALELDNDERQMGMHGHDTLPRLRHFVAGCILGGVIVGVLAYAYGGDYIFWIGFALGIASLSIFIIIQSWVRARLPKHYRIFKLWLKIKWRSFCGKMT